MRAFIALFRYRSIRAFVALFRYRSIRAFVALFRYRSIRAFIALFRYRSMRAFIALFRYRSIRAFVALFRYRSIRALFAPISLSLHTALWLRLCARAGALRAYAYAVALLPAAIRATFGCSLDDMPFGNNSARFLDYRCKRNERRLDRFGFENTRVHKKLSFFCCRIALFYATIT